MKRIDIEPGTIFGLLYVLGPSRARGTSIGQLWLCQCRCGRQVWRKVGVLRYREGLGMVQSCRHCVGEGSKHKAARAFRWLVDRLREDTTPSLLPTPEALLAADELVDILRSALDRLLPVYGFVLRKRFGLDGDGDECTLDEVANELGRTRERVRQIEAKALRTLLLHNGWRLRCFVPRAEDAYKRKMDAIRMEVTRRSATQGCGA